MYNVKRNMYIEILIFFIIFIIYSFSLLRDSLHNLRETVNTYKEFMVNSLKEDIEGNLMHNVDALECFNVDSYFTASSMQSLKEYLPEIENGLNSFNDLFDYGKLYFVLINGEIYETSLENVVKTGYSTDKELINSKDFITSIIFENKLNYKNNMTYLYNKNNKAIIYFVHAIYDEEVKLLGHLVKEVYIHEDLDFVRKAFENFKISRITLKNLNDEVLFEKVKQKGQGLLTFLNTNDVSVKLENFDLILEVSLDYRQLYTEYYMAVVMVIILMFVLVFIIYYNCRLKDIKDSYKKIIFSILLLALFAAFVNEEAYKRNNIELYDELAESIYNLIEYETDKKYDNIAKASKYIEKKSINIHEVLAPSIVELKNYVYTITRKVRRYILPNCNALCITNDGDMYYGNSYINKVMSDTEKEDYEKFINSNNEEITLYYNNLYGNKVSRTLRKIIDEKGNILLTIGFDFDYVGYIKSDLLHKYTESINEDIDFYESYSFNEIIKTIINEKDKGNNYKIDNKFNKSLQTDIEEIINISKVENKNYGVFKVIKNGKNTWKAYIKATNYSDYIVINISHLKLNTMLEKFIMYILFMIYMYALFFVFLYDSKILSTKNYKVKEYEIHSNY